MKKTFPHTGADFSGLNAAQAWLRRRDYAVGPMQRDAPIGVAHQTPGQKINIGKWRTISKKEKRELDGQITPVAGDFRTDDARIVLSALAAGTPEP